MKHIATILRIITGLVFIFSGFVKAVDPVGTQIKFEDYFMAMGLEFMHPSALFFSFLLNTAEFVLGFMLVLKVLPKLALWGALGFMIIFTPLTLWLAVANPVSDCGCFGDAVTLTSWETFWKNIVIVLFIVLALFFGNHSRWLSVKKGFIITAGFVVLVFLFQAYNLRHLPMIDFRPFHEGSDIKSKIIIPPDAEQDVYEMKFYYIYKETGERKEFSFENLPEDYDDTLVWAFDTREDVLVKKGYEPPIHDFVLTDSQGNDLTDVILNDENYSLIMVSFDFDNAKEKHLKEVERVSNFAHNKGLQFYVFTASGIESLKAFENNYSFSGSLCTGDKTMLKTIVRSNPAWVLMKDGHVIKKWHFRDLPDNEELNKFIK